jgi:hypothetical protein
MKIGESSLLGILYMYVSMYTCMHGSNMIAYQYALTIRSICARKSLIISWQADLALQARRSKVD